MKLRRKKSGSVWLEMDCPACGGRLKLGVELARTGRYHCWVCPHEGYLTPQERKSGVWEDFVDSATLRSIQDWTPSRLEALPLLAIRECQRRRIDPEWVAERYAARWDGDRLCWPVVTPSGTGWVRRTCTGAHPKTLTVQPRGLIGEHLLKPGSHIVVTEGDFKSASIPLPWVGVGICGLTCDSDTLIRLVDSQPASVTLALDGGETQATNALLSRLKSRVSQVRVLPLPEKAGPDDVTRAQLVEGLVTLWV